MRISDWSSDVCSSDLAADVCSSDLRAGTGAEGAGLPASRAGAGRRQRGVGGVRAWIRRRRRRRQRPHRLRQRPARGTRRSDRAATRPARPAAEDLRPRGDRGTRRTRPSAPARVASSNRLRLQERQRRHLRVTRVAIRPDGGKVCFPFTTEIGMTQGFARCLCLLLGCLLAACTTRTDAQEKDMGLDPATAAYQKYGYNDRPVEALARADVIAAEDTRSSRSLLDAWGIATPLMAAHRHNEATAAQSIVERLARGERVALVSDAGAPAVSDPGGRIVRAVREAGYVVVEIGRASCRAIVCPSVYISGVAVSLTQPPNHP